MARRHEAVRRLEHGESLDLIASAMGVSFQTVVRYMKLQVAEGGIRLSDVFFGIANDRRRALDEILSVAGGTASKAFYKAAEARGFSWDEANFYVTLKESNIFRGDMYEHIADIEVTLHRLIREQLITEYGKNEPGWWRKGVPLPVRKYCVGVREEDPDPVEDLFAYTTFISLAEILSKNWGVFSGSLPGSLGDDRKRLLSDLNRLNHIRNAVMHPVKNKTWTLDDFEFAKDFRSRLLRKT